MQNSLLLIEINIIKDNNCDWPKADKTKSAVDVVW